MSFLCTFADSLPFQDSFRVTHHILDLGWVNLFFGDYPEADRPLVQLHTALGRVVKPDIPKSTQPKSEA